MNYEERYFNIHVSAVNKVPRRVQDIMKKQSYTYLYASGRGLLFEKELRNKINHGAVLKSMAINRFFNNTFNHIKTIEKTRGTWIFLCQIRRFRYFKTPSSIHFVNIRLFNYLGNEFLVKMYKLSQNYTFKIDTIPKIMYISI